MKESSNNFISKEIESMAKYLIEHKNYKKINENNVNQIQTPKDSFSLLLYELTENNNNLENKNKINGKNKDNLKTKATSKESFIEKNMVKNEYCFKNKFEGSGKLKEKIISDSYIEIEEDDYEDEIKTKHFNYFKIIYTEILKEWKNINSYNLLTKQILSYYFISYCFRSEFEIFINIWNNDEIDKFFIYQIYLFISVLYLEENSYENKMTMRNFLNGFEYSFLNFQILLSFSQKGIENKEFMNFKTRNKIIKSLVQTLNSQNFGLFDDITNLLEYIKKNETLNQILKNLEEQSQKIQNEDN